MILARQIRAARGMLGMSQLELNRETGISINTISKIEKSQKDLEKSGVGTINKIKIALEKRGIKFLETGSENGMVKTGISLLLSKSEEL